MDPDLANILQMCLIMEEIFQISTSFSPKPPSFLGKQISFQEIFELAILPSLPFHRKQLNF
jgi:hypothetical protein